MDSLLSLCALGQLMFFAPCFLISETDLVRVPTSKGAFLILSPLIWIVPQVCKGSLGG